MISPLPLLEDVPSGDEETGFGTLQTPSGNLPLRSLDVSARIDGLMARTQVRQSFANPNSTPLEATYIFPLPDRAAVTSFVLMVGTRRIEGQLQERSKARRAYEQAIRDGQRAAIAEEERPNVFTIRVGNLPPGESVSVELSLTGPVPIDHGEATYRFPLVVAPRYIPGSPRDGDSVGDGTHPDTDAVPDASRITPPILLPGFPSPVRLSVNVEVNLNRLAATDFRSSLHAIQEVMIDGVTRIRIQPGEKLDRDFTLRWRIDDDCITTALHLQPDADDVTRGTFALTIVPPRQTNASQQPRDVVFVLDRSGSMNGWKMVAARRAIGRMIDSLTDLDRFLVIALDDRIESFPAHGWLEIATDRQRFRAVESLARIDARGGTELAAPLLGALDRLTDRQRERVLVLVTDGQVGNEDQILQSLAGQVKGVRIFTLGIDQAVNEGFLKRLAGLGGGYCELVESEDRLDEVMDKVHRRIRDPLWTGLKLEPAGLAFEPDTLTPARCPDLFPGTPLVVMGRFHDHRPGSIASLRLQARDDAGKPVVQTLSGRQAQVLAPIWARNHLRELEDCYATGRGDRATLERQLVERSLKFNVLCRFTAFVAVDVIEVVNPGGEMKRVTQPVELPSGWEMPVRPGHETGAVLAGAMYRAPLPMAAAPVEPPRSIAPRGYSGVFRRLGEALGSRRFNRAEVSHAADDEAAVDGTTPMAVDLSAYRKRAEELRRRLETAADQRRELAVLRLKIDELLDDLKSVGASDDDRRPLADLLAEMTAFLANPTPSAEDFATMIHRVNEALRAFVGQTSA